MTSGIPNNLYLWLSITIKRSYSLLRHNELKLYKDTKITIKMVEKRKWRPSLVNIQVKRKENNGRNYKMD